MIQSFLLVAEGIMSLLLSPSDKIYVWGHNGYGQLGLGDTINQKLPKVLEF